MGRNEFALGVLVGGLVGLAIGYVTRRGSVDSADDGLGPQTIDLTPALQRRNAVEASLGETAGVSE